jgi:SAM-dependent methyltransferase
MSDHGTLPRDQHARSFGSAAGSYDRHRPSYPPAAVRWALGHGDPDNLTDLNGLNGPAHPLRVIDLGAGTGILTRALLAAGHKVVPVEPDEQMRAQLAASTPGITPLAGSAEAIPLADASVDAVVAGQAYHWFDPARTHLEIARVLRPGGVLAALWNVRDESVAWVAELTRVAALEDGYGRVERGLYDDWLRAAGFGPAERATFPHTSSYTPDTLVELIKTRSYFLTAPPERQAQIATGVRKLTTVHPELTGRPTFELPYRTVVYRASLLGI